MRPSAPPAASRHLAAVWFADVVGYSTLASEDEAAALRLVTEFQENCRKAVAVHGGRVIKFVGDGALAEFSSTEAAARSALDLLAASTAVSGRPLRIGIHVGDIVGSADGDVYGEGVNVAARLQQAAEPGQVLASEDVMRHLRPHAAFELGSVGKHRLKGLNTPMQVFAVRAANEATLRHRARRGDPRKWTARQAVVSTGALLMIGGVAMVGHGLWRSAAPGVESDNRSARAHEEAALPPANPTVRSVAVLPLGSAGQSREEEVFSDGVTEELLNALTEIPGLKVTGKASAFGFRDRSLPPQAIADALGVTHLLELGIRRGETSVRITARLVDARSGLAAWSGSYESEVHDVLELQQEIAGSIAAALRIQTRAASTRASSDLGTRNVAALEAYFRGRHSMGQRTPEGMHSAVAHFQQAIRLDPGFAPPWAGLADTYSMLPIYASGVMPREVMPKAEAAAHRALELDPNLADAYASLGGIQIWYHYDLRRAQALLRRAIEMRPGSALTRLWLGIALSLGGATTEGLVQVDSAIATDPLSAVAHRVRGDVLVWGRRYDEGIGSYRRALELDPRIPSIWANLGATYLLLEEWDSAAAALSRAVTMLGADPAFVDSLVTEMERSRRTGNPASLPKEFEVDFDFPRPASWIYALAGDPSRATTWIEDSYEARSAGIMDLGVAPAYDALRSDPRFQSILRRMNGQQ